MASVKVVLRQKPTKEGLFPLAIRITKDRKTSFIHVGYNIQQKEWDADGQRVKKNHPNSNRLNNFLLKKLAEATDTSLELETLKSEISSKAVKQRIKPTGGMTFFGQADEYLDQLKRSGKFNQYSADKPRVKHFKKFLKDSDISFADINTTLLKQFKAYVKGTYKCAERTAVNHLVVIRTIFNQAIAAGITDRKYYPFGKGKIVIKFPESNKIGLTAEEIKVVESLDLTDNPYEQHARNVWLFSFYFAGMRVSDTLRLKWSDFNNDRLFYSMGKNNKADSLQVHPKALAILRSYKRKNPTHDLVFPDLETVHDMKDQFAVQQRITQRVKAINEWLVEVAKKAKVKKKMTMHIARHSFGNISGDKIPIQMLKKLYRHSSITTTVGYQANFIHRDADDALNSVISL
ncbi:MAG: integrase family protein [Bacteroidota bacterium]|nr:integrase family protein [Bacteroidota bacterium]